MSARSCVPGSAMVVLVKDQARIFSTSSAALAWPGLLTAYGHLTSLLTPLLGYLLLAEWPFDPRLESLGNRTIAEHSPHEQSAADVLQYQHWRFQHGIAEGNELPYGMLCCVVSLGLEHLYTHRTGHYAKARVLLSAIPQKFIIDQI